MELNDILQKLDAIRQEIMKRTHCHTENLEVVQYDSGNIGIHWNAIFDQNGKSLIDIPYGWIVASISPIGNRISMYAEPGDFLCLDSPATVAGKSRNSQN